MKYKSSYIGKITAAILGFAVIATTGINAQENEDTDVFELSPFEVDASSDMGYVATSALTGSRLRTSLSDVAASVSVLSPLSTPKKR